MLKKSLFSRSITCFLKRHLRQSRTALLLIAVIVLPATISANNSNAVRHSPGMLESKYSVSTKGIKIGEIKAVYSLLQNTSKKMVKVNTDSRVSANLLVYSYSLDSKEETLITDEGAIQYLRTSKENGQSTRVEGKIEKGAFNFTIIEKGAKRQLSIPRDKYDYTTMECPEAKMRPEKREMTLRLLDLDTLMVVTRKYRWVRNEDIKVDGKLISCKVVDYEDVNNKFRSWVKEDNGFGVIVAKQEGKGRSGSYSVKLTNIVTK